MSNDERKLVRLSDVEQAPIQWLWPGYVPSKAITDLCGDPSKEKAE